MLISKRRLLRKFGRALLACLALHAAGCASSPAKPGAGSVAHQAQHRRQAIEEVRKSATAADPLLRMRAIETAQQLGAAAEPLIRAGVHDPHPAVRYAAWVTAGRLLVPSLADQARAAAQQADESDYVRAAAAFASAKITSSLPQTGSDSVVPDTPTDLGPLAALLWSDRPGMRANAAVLLGESGEASARAMLHDAAKRPTPRASATDQALLDLQVHEAMVKLGDEEQLKPLRLAAYSKDDEVRVLAVLMLGRLGDRTMEGAVMNLLDDDPQELRLAAAQALGDLGWPDGLPVALAGSTSQLERIRSQAALAVGRAAHAIPTAETDLNIQAREAAHHTLDRLLNDPSLAVRLAAAAAVLTPPR